MRILLDMNLSPRWVSVLQQAGFEAQHWSEVGRRDAPDSEIMSFAAASGFVVLTNDLDFSAILAATQGRKPSVVQIRAYDLSPEMIETQVLRSLLESTNALEIGALLTIDVGRARLRFLPLHTEPETE